MAMDEQRAWGALDVVAHRQHGLKTLEARWIHAGSLPAALIESVAPSPAEIEIREDCYLVAPLLQQIGVKFRGAVQLDLKVFGGSPGNLQLAGGTCGGLEIWRKWTVPVGADSGHPRGADRGWVTVQKLRRKRSFGVVDGGVVERPIRGAGAPGCTVELTEVLVGDSVWWTIGFEAGGNEAFLERDLRATAAFVLRPPLPAGLQLRRRFSMSYVEWLRSMSQGS